MNGKWRRAARKRFCRARFLLLFLRLLIIEIRVRAENECGYEFGISRLRGLSSIRCDYRRKAELQTDRGE